MSDPSASRTNPETVTPPGVEPEGPVPEESTIQWRRVHKITPVLNVWKVIAALFAFGIYQNFGVFTELWQERNTIDWGFVLLIGGASFLALALLVLGYSALAWYRMRYAIGHDAVYLHSGIVFRQQRHARLNRIQAVDVVRPLLGRLFGLSRLRIETAGGSDSAVNLAYLRDEEAHRLRREVLAHIQESRNKRDAANTAGSASTGASVGAETGPGQDGSPATPDVDSPERPVHTVPMDRLIVSLIRSGILVVFIVVLIVLVVSALLAGSAAPLFGAVPGVFAWGAILWSQFNGGFNFRSTVSADGIRLRHGLLEQRTQTLPAGRIHAVELKQPLLWRSKDWWRVSVNVAGYVGSGDMNDVTSSTVLLPVGSREEALTALWLVLPDLGVPDPRTVIDAAIEGHDSDAGFLTSPRSARWLDPISRRRNGLLITERGIIMRGGRLTRWASFVPHERTQSLQISRGPLQRGLGLISFQVDGVSGPVKLRAHHLEPAAVLTAFNTAASRALQGRHRESTTQWLQRMNLLTTPPTSEPTPPQAPPPGPVSEGSPDATDPDHDGLASGSPEQ